MKEVVSYSSCPCLVMSYRSRRLSMHKVAAVQRSLFSPHFLCPLLFSFFVMLTLRTLTRKDELPDQILACSSRRLPSRCGPHGLYQVLLCFLDFSCSPLRIHTVFVRSERREKATRHRSNKPIKLKLLLCVCEYSMKRAKRHGSSFPWPVRPAGHPSRVSVGCAPKPDTSHIHQRNRRRELGYASTKLSQVTASVLVHRRPSQRRVQSAECRARRRLCQSVGE